MYYPLTDIFPKDFVQYYLMFDKKCTYFAEYVPNTHSKLFISHIYHPCVSTHNNVGYIPQNL